MKKITILGSTGSIGTQTLEVLKYLDYKVVGLSCGSNIELFLAQIKEFSPEFVCVKNEGDVSKIKSEFPHVKVLSGTKGLVELCQNKENDIIEVATSGEIGLVPTLEAIKNGINIALANKETLVNAGEIVMKMVKENNVSLLPVDSEHSAIFQCCKDFQDVEKIIITASGGPFLNKTREQMAVATVSDALNHPRWNMGKKITIDSATLMNKGLEVIEAHHLFNMPYDKIEVVIHPQSIIHSAIEFIDGSTLAQLGIASMHIPIQYALTYPKREMGIKSKSFNFLNCNLTFFKPDYEKFRCLKLALEAGKIGGTMPAVMNHANDIAVNKFLRGEIKLFEIEQAVERAMSAHSVVKEPTIEDILEISR